MKKQTSDLSKILLVFFFCDKMVLIKIRKDKYSLSDDKQ